MTELKPCKDCGTAKIIWRAGIGNRRPAWYVECMCGVGDYEPVCKPTRSQQMRKKRIITERWNRMMQEVDDD